MRHYIFGGRYGDIVHSLPAVYEYAMRTGTRPRFTTAHEFNGLLDGCSYLEPYTAPVPWARIQDIVVYAKAMFPQDEFVNMACYGINYSPGYHCWSFLRDSWRLSQCPTPPESQPLVFDKRDAKRETALLNKLGIDAAPFVLVSLAGKSSPFSQPNAVLADIHAARPDLRIVDISTVRAERVYDLLGVMDRATALVTIDTMHLHLSAAVPRLPVFAFICDGPTRWNRSDWRPQQVWRCNYGQFADRHAEFRAALQSMNSTPHIYHVYSDYSTSGDTLRRGLVARDSWTQERMRSGDCWHLTGLNQHDLQRSMPEDGHLVYVRDLIEAAVKQCTQDSDIISLSNNDVGCVAGITGQILDTVREFGCTFAHRWDVEGKQITALINSEAEVAKLRWYPGSDWFFMSKAWWIKHGNEMPDMVIGREFWDAVLRQIMKKHGTREILNAVWHEKHVSAWEQPGNRQNLPGNQHNRALAMQFFVANHSDAQDPYRSTWNIQPGTTQQVTPVTSTLDSTRRAQPNLVFPHRLEFHRNNPFSRRLL